MATIKDIARKLGISVSSVSKGLSGASDVSEETRQQILNAALELGYVSRKSKSDSNSRKVCIFVENMGYERIEQFGYEIIVGFRLAATEKLWDVDIVPIAMDRHFDYDYEDYMTRNHYSAGFLLGFSLHNDFLKQLAKTNIPTVLLDNIVYNKNVACVGIDNQQGVVCAVEHLVSLGHTNIAMMNGELHSRVSQERLQGFKLGMAKTGHSVRKELIAHGDYTSSCAAQYVEGFVKNGATAIVCASDLIAHGVLSELNRLDLPCPKQISVTGFDDLPIARYTTPPLTTVRQDRLMIGKSVCMAMSQIMDGNPISRLLLMPELVVRESTGRKEN
jgi:LacI family transcriptional regulator